MNQGGAIMHSNRLALRLTSSLTPKRYSDLSALRGDRSRASSLNVRFRCQRLDQIDQLAANLGIRDLDEGAVELQAFG